ncbi:MAG TPA: UvrD-helicase domain-containing protein [Polyangiaceae bacterium]|nr:UvrD-helicase domain-containing protein [Polyangiaceae bacterium]
MTVTLIDQDVRDNIRRNLGVNLCVEAGAGTGKTTVLVARIVEILRTGFATVDQLAVITFTEKAAAELAARVREGLEAAIRDTEDTDEVGRLETALRDLNRARIETIHAFASNLLRERPIEAGLDPNFEVLDDLGMHLGFDEAYRSWLGDILSRPSPELWRAFNRGFDLKQLREVTELLQRNRAQLPLALSSTPVNPALDTLDELLDYVDELRDLLSSCSDDSDKGAQQIERIRETFTRFTSMRADPGALERELLKPFKIASNAGARKNWSDAAACDRQKEICKELNLALQEYREALHSDALLGILPLVEAFVRDYSERRRMAGLAEFDDLLIWARDLLRDQPAVRRYFQRRFNCVMIDEFQDTDPLQVEIALYLTSDGQDERDWRQLQPLQGKLFVVGDPKQSIYRFRRADISIYEWVKHHVLADGIQVIGQNFRSVDGVIDWLNHAFAQIIQATEGIQPSYHPLQPVRANLAAPHAPIVVLEGGAKSADAVRQEEARLLAGLIERIVRDEEWPVYEGNAERPALWRDIAILLPTRTGIDFYEQALAERNIPYRHEGGRAFFDRQEVRELQNCLKAIDDPTDRLSLVATLRSGAFGCSDDEIFRFVNGGGQLDIRLDATGEPRSVVDALATLRQLRDVRGQVSLPQFISQVLETTRLVEYAITLPQGEQAAANLMKVADQARAFSGVRGGGLRAFVRWLTTSSGGRSDEADASVAETQDDVVRILTIHSAKGLEFPIVALANLNSDRRDIGPLALLDPVERRMELRIGPNEGGFKTPGFDDAYDLEKQHVDAEQRRLLYVAATRARDFLIIPSILDEDKAKGMLKTLREPLSVLSNDGAPTPNTIYFYDTSRISNEPPPSVPASEVLPESVEQAEDRRTNWLSARQKLLERTALGLPVTAISNIEAAAETAATEDAEFVSRLPGGQDEATDNALHRVMERVYLPDARNLDELARWFSGIAGLPEDSAEVITLARNVLASPVVARAVAAGGFQRDVVFSALLADGGFAEGRVDLLFRDAAGLIVVDYKTEHLSRADATAHDNLSRDQAALYAFAVEAASGILVSEVVFVFARPRIERSFTIDTALHAQGETLTLRHRTFGTSERPTTGKRRSAPGP